MNLKLKASEQIGKFIEYWGFKSIDGRVWALIYTSEQPLSTPEIVEELGVSKGLVSIAINELLKHKLIAEAGKVQHGALTYKASDNPAQAVRKVLQSRELKMVQETEQVLDQLHKMGKEQLAKENLSKEKIGALLKLTKESRRLLYKFTRKEIKSLNSWSNYFNKITRFFG